MLSAEPTFERPEVGLLYRGTSFCTATLVSARALLTAAHCLGEGWDQKEFPEAGPFAGVWYVDEAPGLRSSFVAVRYRRFGRELGADDLALVELASPVPSEVAQPVALAARRPHLLESVEVFGYGCTARGEPDEEGPPSKRVARHRYGESVSRLCPGDSGGPRLHGGGQFGVNSAYWDGRLLDLDVVAQVPQARGQLTEQLRQWELEAACPNRCYVDGRGRSADSASRAVGCAESGAYARGQEPRGTPSCWRCARPSAAGPVRTQPGTAGSGWFGGRMLEVCDATVDADG